MARAKARMNLTADVTRAMHTRQPAPVPDAAPVSLREPYTFPTAAVDGIANALTTLFEERPGKRSPVGRTRVNFRIDTDLYDRLTVACAMHKVRQQDVVELALDAVLAAIDKIDGR